MGEQLAIQLRQNDPGFSGKHARAGIHLPQPVQATGLQQQATGQGDALAVIPGCRPPHRQADPMAAAGRRHLQHLCG